MRGLAFLVLLACSGLALADQNNAFEQGKGFGEGKNQGLFSSINSGNVQDKIPAYGTTPAETQYFQGGRGETIGPGTNKMLNCATASPDPDPIKRQECEAINFLARNPQVRPQFNIGYNDPMVAKAREIGRNAESFFQSFGMSMGTSTQCTTKTETTPAQYTTETCSNIREFDGQQCTIGRVVKIDADSNFQCEQTLNSYEDYKCRRKWELSCTGGGDVSMATNFDPLWPDKTDPPP
ncbi:hypothetical protein Hthe01_19050 [Hydrogenophilus thermoluteolus]|uniref:hypothetical protein n=1 Tax=Hydrogenophilus thermoluteolus TaxID=297 RepID=UPI0024A38D7F|nr:hypothetical protein [Hydrogenophilus thermoluteolus]GLW61556.1 hypothetical protein Hthe01_19050 [Hydrogenophilus thermoluteolus]